MKGWNEHAFFTRKYEISRTFKYVFWYISWIFLFYAKIYFCEKQMPERIGVTSKNVKKIGVETGEAMRSRRETYICEKRFVRGLADCKASKYFSKTWYHLKYKAVCLYCVTAMATVEVGRGSVLMPAESPDQGRPLRRGKKLGWRMHYIPRYKLNCPRKLYTESNHWAKEVTKELLNHWGEYSTEVNDWDVECTPEQLITIENAPQR
jgi:hypothetical protein